MYIYLFESSQTSRVSLTSKIPVFSMVWSLQQPFQRGKISAASHWRSWRSSKVFVPPSWPNPLVSASFRIDLDRWVVATQIGSRGWTVGIWGWNLKMVAFPQQTHGVFLLKLMILGWRLGIPPFKENTHMYLHEWLMCMVNGDISFQTTNSSTIKGICSNFQGGNDNSEIQVY